jgi:hypothetical protein
MREGRYPNTEIPSYSSDSPPSQYIFDWCGCKLHRPTPSAQSLPLSPPHSMSWLVTQMPALPRSETEIASQTRLGSGSSTAILTLILMSSTRTRRRSGSYLPLALKLRMQMFIVSSFLNPPSTCPSGAAFVASTYERADGSRDPLAFTRELLCSDSGIVRLVR